MADKAKGTIVVFLRCDPPTVSHHDKIIIRLAKGRFSMADSKKLKAAKADLIKLLTDAMPAGLGAPIDEPVHLHVEWTWPWLVSTPKKVRERGRVRIATRPDSSNLLKTLEDCIVKAGYATDDSLFSMHTLSRWRGEVPGIFIRIEPLDLYEPSDLFAGVQP